MNRELAPRADRSARARPGQRRRYRLWFEAGVVVQRTGAGKSAIYQIAGLIIEGVTVMVSPLIALQKDQVDSINAENAAGAVVVNSQQRMSELADTLEKLRRMQEYADASSCRREIRLRHFGDDFTGPCGNCDNCLAAGAAPIDAVDGTRREVA